MFPSQSPKIGAALVKNQDHEPSTKGAIIYLIVNPNLQLVLDKVEKDRGKILRPKTFIDEETGSMAFIIDSEENIIGLHSTK